MPEFRIGRRLAIDFGLARIGLAVSTIDGMFCSPLATVANNEIAIRQTVEYIEEQEPIEIYVGFPLNLKGEFTRSTELAIEFAKTLEAETQVPIRLVDERLSTKAVAGQISASGKNSKEARRIIDAAAASLILEGAIAFEKSTGTTPGKTISELND